MIRIILTATLLPSGQILPLSAQRIMEPPVESAYATSAEVMQCTPLRSCVSPELNTFSLVPASTSSTLQGTYVGQAPAGNAPLIGGVAGAALGLGIMRVSCRDRFCEMGDLVGILVGAVVGSAVGKAFEGSLALPHR